MRLALKPPRFVFIAFVVIFCLIIPAYGQSSEGQQPTGTTPVYLPLPSLAAIIPLVGELSESLAGIEFDLASQSAYSDHSPANSILNQRLDDALTQLDQAKQAENLPYVSARELRLHLSQARSRLDEQTGPLKKEIERYAAWREVWRNEQQKWSGWQKQLDDQAPRQIREAFNEAQETVSKVLRLIDSHLDRMLELQAKSVEIEKRVSMLKWQTGQTLSAIRQKKLV